ncbi:testis-expressed protein 2-like [Dendronephthya gigantea]|uniref:testis-expressed protein 2-like n=1 Tax=Dendronephthya gigantea TaxID=151771 RepID=UPI00106C846E|nr:testis-expressed protein 2-like [Dendronephthya gigantea]
MSAVRSRMISRKMGPPRPPLPSRIRKGDATVQQQLQDDSPKKPEQFSIRFRRDDANESDEEISIVRKESLPDVQSERTEPINTEAKSESSPSSEHGEQASSPSSGTSSIFSALPLPFLPKSPSPNSGNEMPSFEEPTQQSEPNDDVDEIVFKTSHFEQEHESSSQKNDGDSDGNDSLSANPPEHKRGDNLVVHSKMKFSYLQKMDKRGSPETEKGSLGKNHVELKGDTKTNRFVVSALAESSKLIMPFGLGNVNSAVHSSVKQDNATTEIEIPLYNMLIVSTILFLYFMLPSTSFMNGFVFGGFLMFFLVFALMWLLTPEMSDEERYKRDVLEHEQEMKRIQMDSSSKLFQPYQHYYDLEGWFFKATSYSPLEPVDFSDPEKIQPVYASLCSHILTLHTPREDDLPKIKRSSMLVENDSVKFSSLKEYDLDNGGEIELVPDTMTLKRLWAKKYPIHLKLFEKLSSEDSPGVQESFVLPSVTEEIYLFSPTGRAKEEWYYRIEKVLKPKTHVYNIENIFNTQTNFHRHMQELIGTGKESSSQTQLTWVNALLGRLFWDVWKSEYWNNKVKNRIQNKISRMKLPLFIRYLKVTDMKLGNALPKIQRAHNLHQDNRGIWVDLEVDYEGGIMLTIETMINLEYYLKQLTDHGKSDGDEVILKFSREDGNYSDVSSTESEHSDVDEGVWDDAPTSFHAAESPTPSSDGSASGGENLNSDSEMDGEKRSVTSSASSTPEQENQGWAGKVKNPKGKRILNMLEKVAKSKWVQKAAETKVVQRAVEKFSNLPIELSVEVVRLRGTLAANIPPPPSNRLWLGFHNNPLLSLIARPKLGERNVRLTHVTEWIEYKLKQEFKNMFVLPNMEDLTIRIMDSGFEEKFPPS